MIREVGGTDELDRETSDEALTSLHRYWVRSCGMRQFPSQRDIDPIAFSFAVGRVSLIEVFEKPLRFRYRLASTSLTEQLAYEMTGKFADEIQDTEMRDHAMRLYTTAVERRAPLYCRDDVMLDGRRWQIEALVLPLSADETSVNMLMMYETTNEPVPAWIPPEPQEPDLEFLDQIDVPMLNELIGYWDAKRAGRLAPRWSTLDAVALKAHEPRLVLLDVIDGGTDFRYRFIGSAIARGMGRDSAGQRMSELYAHDPVVLERIVGRFHRVVAEKRPVFTRGRIFWVPNRRHRRFVSLALPLSDNGTDVNIVLAEMLLLNS